MTSFSIAIKSQKNLGKKTVYLRSLGAKNEKLLFVVSNNLFCI